MAIVVSCCWAASAAFGRSERKPQKRPNKESQRNERAHANRSKCLLSSIPGLHIVFASGFDSVFAFAIAFAFVCVWVRKSQRWLCLDFPLNAGWAAKAALVLFFPTLALSCEARVSDCLTMPCLLSFSLAVSLSLYAAVALKFSFIIFMSINWLQNPHSKRVSNGYTTFEIIN